MFVSVDNREVDIINVYIEVDRDNSSRRVYYYVMGTFLEFCRSRTCCIKAFVDLDESFKLLDELRACIEAEKREN